MVRRAALLLATMALAILLAGGVAQAILNGQPDGNRHPYVGALVSEFEGELLPGCSGTLISPTVFLTAGHCTEILILEDLPTFVSFDPTYVPGESELISGTPYLHPQYCFLCGRGLVGFGAYDVGVVVLDEPVTMATYGELPTAGLVDTLPMGQPLTVVGYGTSDFEVGGGPPRDVYLDIRQRADVRLLSTRNRLGEMFIKTSGGTPGRGGEGSCYGDSGGPVFLPDQTTIVAVVSFGPSLRCAGVGYNQRVDLPVVLNWVRSFL